ncbi:MAG: hypothetical protein AAF721_06140 [Myxococcota bacterium]
MTARIFSVALVALFAAAPPAQAAPTASHNKGSKTKAGKAPGAKAKPTKTKTKTKTKTAAAKPKGKRLKRARAVPLEVKTMSKSSSQPPKATIAEVTEMTAVDGAVVYPGTPAPKAVGGTADSFLLGALQMATPDGVAFVRGMVSGYSRTIMLPADTGRFMVAPRPEWARGHDISVECWGRFSGPVIFRAYSGEGPDTREFAIARITPAQTTARSRLRVVVPSAELADGKVRIDLIDADRRGPLTRLEQCRVRRL